MDFKPIATGFCFLEAPRVDERGIWFAECALGGIRCLRPDGRIDTWLAELKPIGVSQFPAVTRPASVFACRRLGKGSLQEIAKQLTAGRGGGLLVRHAELRILRAVHASAGRQLPREELGLRARKSPEHSFRYFLAASRR
jgi:hypothetical protein